MKATRPVARMRKFDIFNPELFLDPLLRAAFQSGLTAAEQSEAIFPFEASSTCACCWKSERPENRKVGKSRHSQRDTERHTVSDTERHTRSAIMPIILRRSALNVDTRCSGMIQFMTTREYEESQKVRECASICPKRPLKLKWQN